MSEKCDIYRKPPNSICKTSKCIGENNYCGTETPCDSNMDLKKYITCPSDYKSIQIPYIDKDDDNKNKCIFTCENTIDTFCTSNSKTENFLKLVSSSTKYSFLLKTKSSKYIFIGYSKTPSAFVIDKNINIGKCPENTSTTNYFQFDTKTYNIIMINLEDLWDNLLLKSIWPKISNIFTCMDYDNFLSDNLPDFFKNLKTPQKCPDYPDLYYCNSGNNCIKKQDHFFDLKTIILFLLLLFSIILLILIPLGVLNSVVWWKTMLKVLGFFLLTIILTIIIVYVTYYIENTTKPTCTGKGKIDPSKIYKTAFVIPKAAKNIFPSLKNINSLNGILYVSDKKIINNKGSFNIIFYTEKIDKTGNINAHDFHFFTDNKFEIDNKNCNIKFTFIKKQKGNCDSSIDSYLDQFKIKLDNVVYMLDDGLLQLKATLLNIFPLKVNATPSTISPVDAYAISGCYSSSSKNICKKIPYMEELAKQSDQYKDSNCKTKF